MQGDLVELRHQLHRRPEVGLHLPRTQEAVLTALDGLDLEVSTGTSTTSVTAVLRGGRPGPAVLLRGDKDAPPPPGGNGAGFSNEIGGGEEARGDELHPTHVGGAAR